MKLGEIAHSRAGDKGNLVNVSVIVYHDRDYELLVARVTEERVTELFRNVIDGRAQRYCIPSLCALNFVLRRPFAESVTRSLRLDAHGKSLSSLMLSLEIEPDSSELF